MKNIFISLLVCFAGYVVFYISTLFVTTYLGSFILGGLYGVVITTLIYVFTHFEDLT